MFYSKPYWDVLIVVLVLVLFFGPKRLPALGRSLGEGMREFKDSITGKSKDSDEAERAQLQAATSSPAVGAAQQPLQATPQAAPAPAQAVTTAQPAPAPQAAPPPAQPASTSPQPPPATAPVQPATVSTPVEPTSDRGSDSGA